MTKYFILFLLLLSASAAFCQKKSKVRLISSTRSEGIKRNGVDVIKVYDGQWQQDFSTMRSDSAYFHQAQNSFEAFGHVVIHQGDTLNIYSDKLNYDGNTKIAVLTDNVVMIDKDARLTTNHFTYNTATRIGTYTDGGKIVDKTNTLTSQNGYYFAGSHDAYFRYNVVCLTTDARIITDTMRYNTQSKINYFYGVTHIYGTKDKDTLDTEFGTYDTKTEIADFTKNNTYRQGTKSLKGDSLYYDRVKGYGRAVDHVVFNDNEQKMTIFGGLGTYFKSNDLTIVTRDPYVIMVTEDRDTTNAAANLQKTVQQQQKTDSLAKAETGKNKTVKNGKPGAATQKPPASTVPLKDKTALTPPANTMPVQQKTIDSLAGRLTMPVIDSFSRKVPKAYADSVTKKLATVNRDSVRKKLAAQGIKPDTRNLPDKLKKMAGNITKADTGKLAALKSAAPKAKAGNVKRDSVYMSADTIETRIMTFKELDTLQQQERLAHIRDTTIKRSVMLKVLPKFIEPVAIHMPRDTSFWHRNYFGPPKAKPQPKRSNAAPKKPVVVKPDSIFFTPKVVLNDTTRVRVLFAFHKAKIFKSDLQAVADSIFYSSSDSTIRCYTKPMVWTQGSQLSGDTINLQLRNKKLDKMDMFPNAFIVNVEGSDSTHFNQVGGKKMRGFFKNEKLSRVYIDGNAETIYFVRDSTTKLVTDMQRSSSSRLWVYMHNNEVNRMGFITKPENRYIPIHVVKDDDKVLKGFLWKPKDRPVSKESVLPSYNKKPAAAAAKPPPAGGTPGVKKPGGPPNAKGAAKTPAAGGKLPLKASAPGISDTTKVKAPAAPGLKKDTTIKTNAGKDSVKIAVPGGKVIKKDSVKRDTVKKP